MKRLSLVLCLLGVVGLSAQTFKCGTLSPEARERLKRDMEFLAADDLQGRLPGTEGANEAVAYIIRNFQEAGLRPFFPGGFTSNSAPRDPHICPEAVIGFGLPTTACLSIAARPPLPPW